MHKFAVIQKKEKVAHIMINLTIHLCISMPKLVCLSVLQSRVPRNRSIGK